MKILKDTNKVYLEIKTEKKCPSCGNKTLVVKKFYRVWRPFGKKSKKKRGSLRLKKEFCTKKYKDNQRCGYNDEERYPHWAWGGWC